MEVRIARPRTLLAVVLLLAAAGSAITVLAQAGDGPDSTKVDFIPLGGSGDGGKPVPVSDAETTRAREIVDKDGRLARLTGGQPYELTQVRAGILKSGEKLLRDSDKLVAFDVVWEKPVDSRGPWLELECQRTVTYEIEALWTGLRSVAIFLVIGEDRVVQFAPGLTADEFGAKLDQTTIDMTKVPGCPEGTDDD